MESERLNQSIVEANQRLKDSNEPMTIVLRGRKLYLRGRLPLKPKEMRDWKRQHRESDVVPIKQQWLNLDLRMEAEGAIEKAESTAKMVGGQLALGRFRWSDWIKGDRRKPRVKKAQTVVDFLRLLEADFWGDETPEDNPKKFETWRVGYMTVMKSLPIRDRLTEDLLRDWIEENSPKTRRREHFITVANKLCQYAKIQADFSDLMGGISGNAVNPRDIPADEKLLELYEQASPEYQWSIGLMIVYGLRNHELFGLSLDNYPVIETAKWTKTGQRYIEPIWIRDANGANIIWDLSKGDRPDGWPMIWNEVPDRSNSAYGSFVTRMCKSHFGLPAYNIRHAFARRCRDRGLDAWTAAAQMGHSERIHLKTYQAWFGKKYHLDTVRKQVGN
jgi:hypothetical protein